MVIKKPISWFNLQFSIKLADKFNHVYYIAYVGLLIDLYCLSLLVEYLQKHSNFVNNDIYNKC